MSHERGASLIEMLLAIAIAAMLLPVLLWSLVAARGSKAQEQQRLQATAYLQELEEATRSVRERDWSLIAANGIYYPSVSGENWILNAGTQTQNAFTKSVTIDDVSRNSSGVIVSSGGTIDPSTKRVTATVGWITPYPSNVSSTFYLTRYLGNTVWNQTSQADFDGGTLTNVETTNASGGEVQLATVPSSAWGTCSLVGGFNSGGNTDGEDVFVSGNYAYLVARSGNSVLTIIDISNLASPTQVGALTISGNSVNSIWVDGTTAYLASARNNSEVVIVDVSNPATPSVSSTINLSGNADALDIVVSGGYAYVGRTAAGATAELQLIRLTGPGAPAEEGGFEADADVNGLQVVGNTAYLATDTAARGLMTVNVTNKAAPTGLGQFNTNREANDVSVLGTQAVVGTANNPSGAEMLVLNVSDPSSISQLGSLEVSDVVTAVSQVAGVALLATEDNGREFMAVNLANPAAPIEACSADLGDASNSIQVVGSYAYLGNDLNSREVAILQNTSASSFQTTGSFVSSSFDADALVGFNYLTYIFSEPVGTNVQLQLATNSDNSTWNYVGPDGTAGTFYEDAGSISLNSVSGQFFRYRATMTGNGSVTPILQDVTVNYSP